MSAFREAAVVRQGDAQGNRMVLRLTTHEGLVVHAIAVAQDPPSRTGPTWTYLVENEGLTLIDVGSSGSFCNLAGGLGAAGYQARDVKRIIVTHGHHDHDGGVQRLVEEAGAELWAHEVYALLLPYDPWEIQDRPVSPIQREMWAVLDQSEIMDSRGSAEHESYVRSRRHYPVSHRVREGDNLDKLGFLFAPGHSPDEICVTFNGVIFTGDHVLPEITPHPTTKTRHCTQIREALPAEYRNEESIYGLETYLRSLKRVVDLGPEIVVLPAHRLFNRNRLNLDGTGRAGEVISHHARRLAGILRKLDSGTTTLEGITRGIFDRRKLVGANLRAALSEVVAHVELLEDTGDLEVAADGSLHRTGSENYRKMIRELKRP